MFCFTDWDFLLRGVDVNKMIKTFNECLKNINLIHNFIILNLLINFIHNFIPYRIIKCNYIHPSCITDDVKYYNNGNIKSDLDNAIAKSNEYTESISAVKDNSVDTGRKLNVHKTFNLQFSIYKTYKFQWEIKRSPDSA